MFETFRTNLPELEIAFRFLAACGMGAAIGLDRELKNRAAGLRTHVLTALAAATFTVLTFEIRHAVVGTDGRVNADPIRIIEAVTAGVAFLAGGAIFRGGGDVHGLTTGAGMWLAGAVGVACGCGYILLALIATIMAIAVLDGMKRVQDWLQIADNGGATKSPAGSKKSKD